MAGLFDVSERSQRRRSTSS